MNPKHILLSATILGGLLFAPVLVTAIEITDQTAAEMKFTAPEPAQIVQPLGLQRNIIGETVTLSLTIDKTGRAHDIKVLSHKSQALQHSMETAVSQWQFTPATRDGKPVSVTVTLPVQLEARKS